MINEVKEIEVVTLENNKDYMIIDTIDDYVYLAEKNDPEAFCIRKIEKEGDDEYFVGLNSDAEFDKALLEFTKKHKDMLEK